MALGKNMYLYRHICYFIILVLKLAIYLVVTLCSNYFLELPGPQLFLLKDKDPKTIFV